MAHKNFADGPHESMVTRTVVLENRVKTAIENVNWDEIQQLGMCQAIFERFLKCFQEIYDQATRVVVKPRLSHKKEWMTKELEKFHN